LVYETVKLDMTLTFDSTFKCIDIDPKIHYQSQVIEKCIYDIDGTNVLLHNVRGKALP